MNIDQKILTLLLENGVNNVSDIDILNNAGILKDKDPEDVSALLRDIKTLKNAPKDLLLHVRKELDYVI